MKTQGLVLIYQVLVVCISAIATARTTFQKSEEARTQPEDISQDDSYIPIIDVYNPSTVQHLPNVESPSIPFNLPEPSTDLKPPQYYENPPVSFLEVPVPSLDLKAPSEASWNPQNNPIFYYELPASLTKLDTPTYQFPKKYNKDVHSKEKSFSSQPKVEIELIPIEEKDLFYKRNELDKKFNNLAKLQNQKELENLKAFSNHKDEPTVAATGYTNNNDYDDGISQASEYGTQGLSADIISSMGIPHHDSTKDRLTFHVVGHDGPHTYKWGYDTGKGHNRQFRFEEKDKTGLVKGHYGYYDKHGKLQIVNYDAHPHEGFHAKRSTNNENDN
ncbi:hypothetical protein HHI36_006681 [Cryptolaemus montrouzieri]|uniref:Uncharacterized protein n=1 Tax=Cryptolaemus montrouzieri TaxID=559131 RepID=A0ABD2NYV1_9CUCU